MTYDIDSQLVEPVTDNFFRVWTEPKWLPWGKVGFEKLSGINLGTTEVIEYAEGDDRFYRLLYGRTKFGPITLKKGHDKSGYGIRWRMAMMEMTKGVGKWGSGGPRLATNPRAKLFIGITDRNDPRIIVTKFIFHEAAPVALPFGELTTKSNEAWEESLELRFERVELPGYNPTVDGSPAWSGVAGDANDPFPARPFG